MDEEVIVLEEQLATATADIERLQAALAEAQALLQTRDEQRRGLKQELDAVRQSLTEREAALGQREGELEGLRRELGEAREEAALGVARYREAMLAARPELPAELVGGDTIEALDRSVEQAVQTVARVRQHLDDHAASHRVPNGAPPRAAPDLSSLTPGEKIRLGLESSK